jgi:hypothetical protein
MGLERGVALVATWQRWAAGTVLLAVAILAATEGALGFVGAHRPLESLVKPMAIAAAAGSLLLLGTLRAEESRLARELRVARTGTPALRESTIARRDRAPLFARLLSTQLGFAAILVAEGDPAGAASALAAASALTRGGRVDTLRAVVDADIERAGGSPAARTACIARLAGIPSLGNRQGDLYRLHVLSKAVLEQGDADVAFDLARELAADDDDDRRVYATWLRVWFDFDSAEGASPEAEGGDPGPPLPALEEGDIRLATLVARVQGAGSLVTKLEERLVAIARPEGQG